MEKMLLTKAMDESNLNPTPTPEAGAVIDRLYLGMREDGYEVGGPSEEVERMDRVIYEGGECRRCEGRVTFHPFFQATPRSYRTFVVCPLCGWTRGV